MIKSYDISYLIDLDKEYAGSEIKEYLTGNKCTLAEFVDAGKIWANDKMSNDEFTEEEFNDAVEYYDAFGSSNKLK